MGGYKIHPSVLYHTAPSPFISEDTPVCSVDVLTYSELGIQGFDNDELIWFRGPVD